MEAVLITGGTSGIGLAVATALAAQGRPVAVLGRDETRCAAARKTLGQADVLVMAGDTTGWVAPGPVRTSHRPVSREMPDRRIAGSRARP